MFCALLKIQKMFYLKEVAEEDTLVTISVTVSELEPESGFLFLEVGPELYLKKAFFRDSGPNTQLRQ